MSDLHVVIDRTFCHPYCPMVRGQAGAMRQSATDSAQPSPCTAVSLVAPQMTRQREFFPPPLSRSQKSG